MLYENYQCFMENKKPEWIEELKLAANTFASEEDCDVLLMNSPMNNEAVHRFAEELQNCESKKSKIVCILTTNGGSPHAAYKIARMMQQYYNHVICCISGWCKSAGTLCTLGASEIIMTDTGELGPLDMQVYKQDEISGMDSGLIVSDAFATLQEKALSCFEKFTYSIIAQGGGAVRFKTASEISSAITQGLFDPIYKQIDPAKVGEMARFLAVAEAYGSRLNKHTYAQNLRPNALHQLTREYPSHVFVIDREEARTSLFHRVSKPTENLSNILTILGGLAKIPSDPEVIISYLNNEKSSNSSHENSTSEGKFSEQDSIDQKGISGTGTAKTPKGNSEKRTSKQTNK